MCVRLSLCLSLSLFTGLMGCWLFRFPAQIHIASSLNKDLWRQMADVSSTEARALYAFNTRLHPGLAAGGFGAPCSRSLEGCLGLSYYTPNVNIARCVHISNGERGACVGVCVGVPLPSSTSRLSSTRLPCLPQAVLLTAQTFGPLLQAIRGGVGSRRPPGKKTETRKSPCALYLSALC